jgi:hypothetical protein
MTRSMSMTGAATLVLVLLSTPAWGQDVVTVEIPGVPPTLEAYVAMRNEVATTPEGGAALFVAAMETYVRDPDLGMRFFTAILVNDGSLLRDDPDGYGGKAPGNSSTYLIRRLDDAPWITRSYWLGTSPGNGYTPPAGPLVLRASRNRFSEISDDEVKIFVACSGADSPRPIRLKRNNRGVWKVAEFSSLVVGIRPPEEEEDDAL